MKNINKKKDVIQKWREFVGKLSDGELTDLCLLVSAFRGPDNKNEDLKNKTTEVIRAFLLPAKRPNRLSLPPVNYNTEINVKHALPDIEDHFCLHIMLAVAILTRLGYYKVGEHKMWLK